MSDVDQVLLRMQTDYDFYLAVRLDPEEALGPFDLDDNERAAFAEPESRAMWRLLAARSGNQPAASRERALLDLPVADELGTPDLDPPRPLGPFPPDPPPPDPPPPPPDPPPPPPDPPQPPIEIPPPHIVIPPPSIVIPPIDTPVPPPSPVVSPTPFVPAPLPFGGPPSPPPLPFFGMLVTKTEDGDGDIVVDVVEDPASFTTEEVSQAVEAIRAAETPEDRLAATEHLMEVMPWRR